MDSSLNEERPTQAGTRPHRRFLTATETDTIRVELMSGASEDEMARHFGVRIERIKAIRQGRVIQTGRPKGTGARFVRVGHTAQGPSGRLSIFIGRGLWFAIGRPERFALSHHPTEADNIVMSPLSSHDSYKVIRTEQTMPRLAISQEMLKLLGLREGYYDAEVVDNTILVRLSSRRLTPSAPPREALPTTHVIPPDFPSVAALLCCAFAVPALKMSPEPVPPGSVCAQSGIALESGYCLDDILSPASSELAETFPFREAANGDQAEAVRPTSSGIRRGRRPLARPADTGGQRYISEEVARSFTTRFSGNLAVVDEQGYRPVVARASATLDRPSWRDLLTRLKPGKQTVVIMTDEAQRRLWPQAAVSCIGPNWQVLLNEGASCQLLSVEFTAVLKCLALIEEVYGRGFSKAAIRTGLLTLSSQPVVRSVGHLSSRGYEAALLPWRGSAAFAIALFIAQHPEEQTLE